VQHSKAAAAPRRDGRVRAPPLGIPATDDALPGRADVGQPGTGDGRKAGVVNREQRRRTERLTQVARGRSPRTMDDSGQGLAGASQGGHGTPGLGRPTRLTVESDPTRAVGEPVLDVQVGVAQRLTDRAGYPGGIAQASSSKTSTRPLRWKTLIRSCGAPRGVAEPSTLGLSPGPTYRDYAGGETSRATRDPHAVSSRAQGPLACAAEGTRGAR